ncbi:MAG: carbohydrate ABC transporter permease [Ruminococcaceae bacterium]|nr:carbohydrate ABC transporter permease [Oscillospiraceae bacterium]
MKRKTIRQGSPIVDVVIYTFIGIVALVTLYPFIYIASNSISDPIEVAANSVWLFPKGLSFKSYEKVFSSPSILRSFFNSVFFTVLITLLSVTNAIMAGYALSKKGMVFRRGIVIFIMIPMFFSAGMIPSFVIINRLGMFNTLWAIILPSIVSIWNIILARTYITTLPPALREAARIDGANDFQILFTIIFPLVKPIIAVLALYTALGVWNSWFNFMIYLPKYPEWHPLQMFLVKSLIWGNMSGALGVDIATDPELLRNKMMIAAIGGQLKYTVIMVASLPVIMIYPFVQKYFIQGALLGSLKE